MDNKILKKMNEVIGFMKLIERELMGRASLNDRAKLLQERKIDLDKKLEELDEIMATTLSDAQAINYHKKIREEADKLMNSIDVKSERRYF